jgi:type I restriction enzyme S subunit
VAERRALGEFVTLQRGQSYKGDLVGLPGPYLLGLGTIERNGGFRADILRTYGGDSPNQITLGPGDLYVSFKDVTHTADLLGAVARVPLWLQRARLTQDTIRLDVRGDLIDRDFLYWSLRTPEYRSYCRTRGTGTTNLDLSRDDFLAFELRVPGRAQQRAIADVLGALDDKIAANSKIAATADGLASAIVRTNLTERSASLSELALVTMGSSPPGESYNEDGVGVPFFQGVRDFGLRFPAVRVWTSSPLRRAHAGDTLVSVRAPVGQVNVARTELCIGRGLASVRSRESRPWTLFHVLRSVPELWAPFEAEGTVFGSINAGQLASLPVPQVASGRGAVVESELAAIEQRLGAALAENLVLAATRDALLPALMSGALRVRDAERIASDLT